MNHQNANESFGDSENEDPEDNFYPELFIATVIFKDAGSSSEPTWIEEESFYDLIGNMHDLDLVTCGLDGPCSIWTNYDILGIDFVMPGSGLLVTIPIEFYAHQVGEDWRLTHQHELPEVNWSSLVE